MRTLITLIILFICTGSMAQSQNKDQEKEIKILRKMATKKAIELQKELGLTIYNSKLIEKTIFEYSVKANKVLQSNLSTREKSKSLSNIAYFQNKELKEILTVNQFYQYLTIQNINVASF